MMQCYHTGTSCVLDSADTVHRPEITDDAHGDGQCGYGNETSFVIESDDQVDVECVSASCEHVSVTSKPTVAPIPQPTPIPPSAVPTPSPQESPTYSPETELPTGTQMPSPPAYDDLQRHEPMQRSRLL